MKNKNFKKSQKGKEKGKGNNEKQKIRNKKPKQNIFSFYLTEIAGTQQQKISS